MNLKELMSEDLEAVFFDVDGHGEPATYNGVETVVIPFIGDGNSRQPSDSERRETATFSIMASAAPSPLVGDILVHNGVEWQMVGVLSLGALRHKLRFVTDESAVIWKR